MNVTLHQLRVVTEGSVTMSRLRPCKNPSCHHLIDFNSQKQYCTNVCRQKAYRDRKKCDPIRHKNIQIGMCVYCCETFEKKHPSQRCCKPAHRQALYRQLKALGEDRRFLQTVRLT